MQSNVFLYRDELERLFKKMRDLELSKEETSRYKKLTGWAGLEYRQENGKNYFKETDVVINNVFFYSDELWRLHAKKIKEGLTDEEDNRINKLTEWLRTGVNKKQNQEDL